VRVDSDGDGGSVDQSNNVWSSGTAANLNGLEQGASQAQGGSGGVQAIGQDASNDQSAAALSAALQFGASNSDTPVRVDSDGDGGDVSQSNNVGSSATAANLNGLGQSAGQAQGGVGGIAIQAIGQSASSAQSALALSAALQFGASNSNSPVAVDSAGDAGDVSQSNSVASAAKALNLNLTRQGAEQAQSGSCGCAYGVGIQAIGQQARSWQGARGASLAAQLNPAIRRMAV
jgi:hypothetical protein